MKENNFNLSDLSTQLDDNLFEEELDKKNKSKNKNTDYKVKECKIISYNETTKELDVLFDNYGIRINNSNPVTDSTVSVKYKGAIGKSNFICKI